MSANFQDIMISFLAMFCLLVKHNIAAHKQWSQMAKTRQKWINFSLFLVILRIFENQPSAFIHIYHLFG